MIDAMQAGSGLRVETPRQIAPKESGQNPVAEQAKKFLADLRQKTGKAYEKFRTVFIKNEPKKALEVIEDFDVPDKAAGHMKAVVTSTPDDNGSDLRDDMASNHGTGDSFYDNKEQVRSEEKDRRPYPEVTITETGFGNEEVVNDPEMIAILQPYAEAAYQIRDGYIASDMGKQREKALEYLEYNETKLSASRLEALHEQSPQIVDDIRMHYIAALGPSAYGIMMPLGDFGTPYELVGLECYGPQLSSQTLFENAGAFTLYATELKPYTQETRSIAFNVSRDNSPVWTDPPDTIQIVAWKVDRDNNRTYEILPQSPQQLLSFAKAEGKDLPAYIIDRGYTRFIGVTPAGDPSPVRTDAFDNKVKKLEAKAKEAEDAAKEVKDLLNKIKEPAEY